MDKIFICREFFAVRSKMLQGYRKLKAVNETFIYVLITVNFLATVTYAF